MTENDTGHEVSQEFLESPHYHEVVATDVFGGIIPDGSGLHFDLVLTGNQVPRAIIYEGIEVEPGVFNRGAEKKRIPAQGTALVMNRQVGVFIPGNKIRTIANWFQQKAEEWESGPGA
jgi:hypothetical protein